MTTSNPTNDTDSGLWVSATDLPVCASPDTAIADKIDLKNLIARAEAQEKQTPPSGKSCQQQLAISFFFDGTGNNEKLDAPLNKTSNVARLYSAHAFKPKLCIEPIYIPGVGTPFPQVGDKGGTLGDAFGKGGEKRIEYAMAQFDDRLIKAEALAHNPTNKIIGIHVAIFGFSRGATEARAFAVQLHQRLQGGGSRWTLKGKGHPLRIYFMGLFDTVASVGISNTIRNPEKRRLIKGAGRGMPIVGPLLGPLLVDAVFDNSEVLKGHNDWASELRVPPSVERCLHFTAAHEVRESFPLDTVRVAASTRGAASSVYPAACTEITYPGMHSDVGGGYAPGEQGRSAKLDAQLSQVPLLHMYRAALDAGVPLLLLPKLKPEVRDTFQLDEAFSKLFDYYMGCTNASGGCVEQQNARHLYLYFRWRKLRATTEGDPYLETLAQKRDAAQAKADKLERERKEAWDGAMQTRAQQLEAAYAGAPAHDYANTEVAYRAHWEQNKEEAAARKASMEQRNAKTLEANAARSEAEATGNLYRQIKVEDQRFVEACEALKSHTNERQRLNLHEKTLLAAWEAPLLKDEKIIEFFDFHVHDSVAGFRATGAGYADNSSAAKPRDVYQGRAPWPSAGVG